MIPADDIEPLDTPPPRLTVPIALPLDDWAIKYAAIEIATCRSHTVQRVIESPEIDSRISEALRAIIARS